MKTKLAKILAVLSASAMAFSLLAGLPADEQGVITARAETSGINDEATDINNDGIYEIANAQQLIWFAEHVNGNAEYADSDAALVADIVLNEDVLKDYKTLGSGSYDAWTPIGTAANPYLGTFDGNGHTISGLYAVGGQFMGMFGVIGEGAELKNITIEDSYVMGNATHAGILCGMATNAKIDNCSVTGYMSGGQAAMYSLLCGNITGGSITYCKTSGYASGGQIVGAVCGLASNATIESCWSDATTKRLITSGNSPSGGLFGSLDEATTAKNCYFAGKIEDTNGHTGAIAGHIGANATISNCYSSAVVSGSANGIMAYNNDSGIADNYLYYDKTVSSVNYINPNYDAADLESDIFGYATTKFSDGTVLALLSKGDGAGKWKQDSGDTYPTLVWVEREFYDCTYTTNHTDEDQNSRCDECGKLMYDYMRLEGYSLALNGNIEVNFHITFNENITPRLLDYMTFVTLDEIGSPINSTRKNVYFGDVQDTATVIDGITYYVFTYEIPAKDMTKTISASYIRTNGEYSQDFYFTVKEYAEYIINNAATNEDYAKAASLVKAMLNYGAYSQLYFGSNTDKLANESIDSTLDELTADDLVTFAGSVQGELPEGMEYYASSLILKSQTSVRHYFTVDSEVLTELPEFEGYELIEKSEGLYYIQKDNISAQMLGFPSEISLADGSWSITYCPMSYAYAVLKTSDKTSLVNLVTAMYEYYREANKYFTIS